MDQATLTQHLSVTAFSSANSREFLSDVFAAYRAEQVAMFVPTKVVPETIPGVQITGQKSFVNDHGWFDETLDALSSPNPAQVSFSSGTTGTPKAILLSHLALSDVVNRVNTLMEMDNTVREYIGIPVTFSFGFGRARAVAAVGGRSFLPENGFNPSEIGRMLAANEINAVSAVPTLWRLLLANKDAVGDARKKLRWIEIGSQYMSGSEKDQLRTFFPNAKIVQHYGMTEASRTSLLDISEAPIDRLESVGRAEGGIEIGTNPDGLIRTRGDHVATGIITANGITPLADRNGWFVSSDKGRIDDGWLYYEGRQDEVINSGGIKIDPAHFETRMAERLQQSGHFAIGKVTDDLRGEKILLAVEQADATNLEEIEHAAVLTAEEFGLIGKGALTVREVSEIPRTATGKIKRAELATTPPTARMDARPDANTENGTISDIQTLWAEALGVEPHSISRDKSFYDLGGDSLSALTAILRMETKGIDADIAKGILEGSTIADLEARSRPDTHTNDSATPKTLSLTDAVNAIHATRGLLAFWVVIVHWLPGLLARLGMSQDLYVLLNPALRFGTPGFAMVFGVGIGALRITSYRENPRLFKSSLRFGTMLVVGGVLVLVLLKAGVLIQRGEFNLLTTFPGTFYSVISYYALAMLSLPIFMPLLTKGSNTALTLLCALLGAAIIHEVLFVAFASKQPGGVLELIKILFTAKYGFFRMSVYVLIGACIGWYVRQGHKNETFLRDLTIIGSLLITFGGLQLYLVNPVSISTSFNFPKPWHLAIYAGVTVMIIAAFIRLIQGNGGQHGYFAGLLQRFAVTSGLLALPIFVGHEMVIPAKTLLVAAGMGEQIALILPLGLFIGALGLMYRRLMGFMASMTVNRN